MPTHTQHLSMCSGFLESSVQLLLPHMGWARDCSRCTLSPFVIESGKTMENKGHSFLETQKPGKRKGWESEAKSFFPRIPGQPKLTSFPFAPASFRNKQRADRWCFYFTPRVKSWRDESVSSQRRERTLFSTPFSVLCSSLSNSTGSQRQRSHGDALTLYRACSREQSINKRRDRGTSQDTGELHVHISFLPSRPQVP